MSTTNNEHDGAGLEFPTLHENVKTWPERIYLQHGCDDLGGIPDFREMNGDEATWCQEKIGRHDVEYIRADLAAPLPQAPQPEQASEYPHEDQAFYRFWRGHILNDLMQPPLCGIDHSTARYIWNAAIQSGPDASEQDKVDAKRYRRLVDDAISVGSFAAIDFDEVVLVVPVAWANDWREKTGDWLDSAIEKDEKNG